MLKKLALFFAIVYSVFLLVISLVSLDKLPKVEINYGDKIFHFLAYMFLSFLWYCVSFYQYNSRKSTALTFGFVFSVVFGIVVEVLQSVLTTYRTLDMYDITANTLGVLIMIFLLAITKRFDTI